MSGNDWATVSWDKRGHKPAGRTKEQQVNKALQSNGSGSGSGVTVLTSKKYGAGGNTQAQSKAAVDARKLDEDSETTKHEKVSHELKVQLQKERQAAGMTQKELATSCNVKPSIIQDYEAGRGIPNPTMLQKIERALKTKNPELKPGTLTKAQKSSKKT